MRPGFRRSNALDGLRADFFDLDPYDDASFIGHPFPVFIPILVFPAHLLVPELALAAQFAALLLGHGGNADDGQFVLDGRTTTQPGCQLSLKIRKRVEEISGWIKTVGGFRRSRYRGLERT